MKIFFPLILASSTLEPASLAFLERLVSAHTDEARNVAFAAFESAGLKGTRRDAGGGHEVLSFEAPGATPHVALIAHLDTVFKTDAPRALKVNGERLEGPGVIDDKGGVALILALVKSPTTAPYLSGIRVILNDDEETGSPASKAILKDLVKGFKAALLFEPGLPDGALVSAQSGIRWVELTVRGKAAHAGMEPEKGLNACVELAHKVVEIAKLADLKRGLSVSPGIIEGGSAPNVVCEAAKTTIDIRYIEPKDLETTLAAIEAIARKSHLKNALLGIETTAEIKIIEEKPPLPPASSAALLEVARKAAMDVGLPPLKSAKVGYVSDGNQLAGTGVKVLVGLGPYGGGMHTAEEFMLVKSFDERLKLGGALLSRLLKQ